MLHKYLHYIIQAFKLLIIYFTGGEKSTSPLGSWTIPPIIKDEELYRSEHLRPTTATN